MKKLALILGLSSVLFMIATPAAAVGRGRFFEPGQRTRLNFTLGRVDPFEASVVETDRPINQFRPEDQRDNAESFSLEDFGFGRSHDTLGLSFEHIWKYLTLFIDGSQMSAEAIGTAPRDLFMSVDGVQFEGESFDYQAIPVGTLYDAKLDTTFLNTRLAVTPWTFNPGGRVQFVPWVHVGLFGMYGAFDVDAGPATGTLFYENPPRNYVVGGRADGDVIAFGPEIGIGGELTLEVGRSARLAFQGNYSIFTFSGTTSDLGASSRNEKAVDYDYSATDGRVFFEVPMGRSSKFLVGAEYRVVRIDVLSEALDRSVGEILQLREKFNKNIGMSLTTVNLFAGFRF